MGGQRNALAALPPGMTRYPLYRRLGEPRAGLDRCGTLAPTGIRSLNRRVHRESLYRLSYPGPQCIKYTLLLLYSGIGFLLTVILTATTKHCIYNTHKLDKHAGSTRRWQNFHNILRLTEIYIYKIRKTPTRRYDILQKRHVIDVCHS
jgi:hypothetical protein